MPGTGTPSTLRQAVEYRLLASPSLTSIVGARIYFGAVPQTASLLSGPALTCSVPSRPYGHNLAGPDGTSSARVKFSAYSTLESQAAAIAQALRDRFDGFAGAIGTVQITASILLDEPHVPNPPAAGTDQWIYEVDATYRINHRAPVAIAAAGFLLEDGAYFLLEDGAVLLLES